MTDGGFKKTTLQNLLSRFHFGVTLFAVALSGLTILFAGITALRGYADRNLELAAQLGAYSVEPALVFNDPVAAQTALAPLTKVPGIERVQILDDRGRQLTEWDSPESDPAPIVSDLFFPKPVSVAIERNGSKVGKIQVWGNSATLVAYAKIGLFAGLACLIVTALGTVILARRFEYELVKPLNEIATVAHDVRLHRSFDKRVNPISIVELDRLGGDINALLDELQGWQGHMENEHAALAHRAMHDALTAMPNRSGFDDQLSSRIAAARHAGSRFALLYIDADNFKEANDRFGHPAGDTVLVTLGKRIKATLRKGDFAARIGGDEFVVIMDPLTDEARALGLAEQIRIGAADPIALPDDQSYRLGVSVGVAIYPEHGRDTVQLLTAADSAMYADKSKKRG